MPSVPAPLLRLFRLRDYRLMLTMVILTTIVQTGQGVAVGWEVYERTGSALALGWLGVAQFAPIGLFFLPAGQIADRHDRRKVMAVSLVIWALSAALLLTVSLTGASIGWVYAALALTGLAMLLNRASRDALLPAVVPTEQLAEAVAWNSSSYQMAAMAGPALAGALIAYFGKASVVYGFNLACVLGSIVATLAITRRAVASRNVARSWHDLFGGVVHVWREKVVLGLVAIDLFAMLFGTVTALLPIFAKDVLKAGPEGLGLMSSAPAVGAFTMALIQGVRRPYKRAGPAFLWAIGTYGIAMIVFGLSPWFWLSFAMLVIAGAADNIGAVVRQTTVQLHTPDALRGRVSAVNRVLISASNELGAARAGMLAAAAGPATTVLFGGAVTLAVVLLGWRLFPELRGLGELRERERR